MKNVIEHSNCASPRSWRTVGRNVTGLRECQKSKHERTKQHHIEGMLHLNAILMHQTTYLLQHEKSERQNKDNYTTKL
jgi:hypothetical protein